ncbi:WD repeat and coiled-coil-containing protein [Parasteatoda tepidariorum]|uniref:WD repeat and coiled-coil-containing protein n=1 Tax=Parasteatoda tepidariorum TaxID=114398 RepID=UPI00077FDC4C|nr:WD repeat and coiled-coil-containing protein [Parasteatoda tepidariorum]
MDVGCWLLKTTSANLLKKCVNPVWGLLYCDGASVFLLPVSCVDDQSYLLPKVLKLENVGLIHDISCSPCYQNCYYVAVISSSEAGLKVSVWKAVEEEINEPFKISNEAYICGIPLPQGQGLSWHPLSNVLCIVCQNEAFIFNNDSKTGSLEKIKSFSGTERFTSCCWNYSGSLLIFATHSKLLFYNFTYDTDLCEPVFSFVIGRVCSLETVDQTRLLCAIELPLSDVIRHQVENTSHTSVGENGPSTSNSNSLVANSQLLLIGYNAIDGKPYIMTKIDIEEILTPNIMVYEPMTNICIVASSCSSRIQFFSVEKIPIAKITEMVLEKGKVPKGIAISTFNNTKLLWLLSGQSCEDCTASLNIPDDGYISCNMTFRVIALKALLGPEKRFIVQEKDFASCFDRRNTLRGRACSESRIKLPERQPPVESVPPKADTLPRSTPIKTSKTMDINTAISNVQEPKKEFCDKAVEAHLDRVEPCNEVENDDKSVLSYYSAESIVMPKKIEINSSSNEDYYSIEHYSSVSRGSTLRGNIAERKIFDIERCVLDMFETHSTELNDIKAELRELKKVVSGISALHYSSFTCTNSPSNAQLLCHIQELQHSVHIVENKLDSMTVDINSRLKHQDRKLSEIRKELNTLLSKRS